MTDQTPNLFLDTLDESWLEISRDVLEDMATLLEAYNDPEIMSESGTEEDPLFELEPLMVSLRQDFPEVEESVWEDIQGLLEESGPVKRVDSSGNIRRTKTRQALSRRATMTKKKSRVELKRIAKKAARTRKRDGAGMRAAKRKRAKAMKIRKKMGL